MHFYSITNLAGFNIQNTQPEPFLIQGCKKDELLLYFDYDSDSVSIRIRVGLASVNGIGKPPGEKKVLGLIPMNDLPPVQLSAFQAWELQQYGKPNYLFDLLFSSAVAERKAFTEGNKVRVEITMSNGRCLGTELAIPRLK